MVVVVALIAAALFALASPTTASAAHVGQAASLLAEAAGGREDAACDAETALRCAVSDIPDDRCLNLCRWRPIPLTTEAQRNAGIEGGEGMQMVFALQYAPSDPGLAYLVSDQAGVVRGALQPDGRFRWERLQGSGNNLFRPNGGVSLAVDPANAEVVFVAASNHAPEKSPAPNGIWRYRPTEGWRHVRVTHYRRLEMDRGGTAFAFADPNPATPWSDVVYAGTHDQGLLRSSDGGDTWEAFGGFEGHRVLDVRLSPSNPSKLYVSTDDHAPSQGRYGLSAVDLASVPPTVESLGAGLPAHPRTIAFDRSPARAGRIYATAGVSGVYRSSDQGANFAAANAGLPVAACAGRDPACGATFIASSPADPFRVFVSFLRWPDTGQPFVSTDGGESWSAPSVNEMDMGGLVAALHDKDKGADYWGPPIAVHPTVGGEALATGVGHQIERTTDGGSTWRYFGEGYSASRVGTSEGDGSGTIAFDATDPERFVLPTIDFGPMYTADDGAAFRQLKTPRFSPCNNAYDGNKSSPIAALDPFDPGRAVVATGSTDFSKNQIIAVSPNIDAPAPQWACKNAIGDFRFAAFHPWIPGLVYAGASRGAFRSADHGETWDPISFEDASLAAVAAIYPGSESAPLDFLYAKDFDSHPGLLTVRRSRDGGYTWEQLGSPFYPDSPEPDDVGAVVVNPENPDEVFVATRGGIMRFDGSVWSDANGEGPDRIPDQPYQPLAGKLRIRSLAVDPKCPNILYAGQWVNFLGHTNGVFRSTDGGHRWAAVNFNIDPVTAWSLSVSPHTREVYIGTSNGTWRLPPPFGPQCGL